MRPRDSELSIQDHITNQLNAVKLIAEQAAADRSRRHKYRELILGYVSEHFSEPDMGLKRLALQFAFSEVYLSNLFRQIAGMTFSTYLEKLRMDEAVNSLRTTRMTVDQIADAVGYASAHAFRRAFKRRLGVSPSSFKDSMITANRPT